MSKSLRPARITLNKIKDLEGYELGSLEPKTGAWVAKKREPHELVVFRGNSEPCVVAEQLNPGAKPRRYLVRRDGPSLELKEKDMLSLMTFEEYDRLLKGEMFYVEMDDESEEPVVFNGLLILYLDYVG